MKDLFAKWVELKDLERKATEERRIVEDRLIGLLEIPESFEGSKSLEDGLYKVKIVGRMTRKIDSDKLQELAAEHGLTEHLSSLFRWKAEINAASWKATNEQITKPLLGAITTTPARASFTITKEI